MIESLSQDVSFVVGDDAFLCPNLYVVKGAVASLLIDVTNRPDHLAEALIEAGAFSVNPRQIYVVLTHFHDDHIACVNGLPSSAVVLCSKNTSRYLPPSLPNKIQVISDDTTLGLGGLDILLLPVPSLHSKGSLDVLVRDILFTGDSLGSRSKGSGPYYNHEVALEMEKRYVSIPFSVAIQSHPKAPRIEKDTLLASLRKRTIQGFESTLEDL